MKIVIAGGSGQVGTLLARAFHAAGDQVIVLSRRPAAAPPGPADAEVPSQPGQPWKTSVWDARTAAGAWPETLEGAAAVINLAGRSVNCRYTPENRRAILDSRVASTRAVGAAVAAAKVPPRVWLQMSTATIYPHRYDAPNDEADGMLAPAAPDGRAAWKWSVEVARAWESAVEAAPAGPTRRVILRAAMVMSPDRGGIFDVLLGLVRRGLGGSAAGGRQFVSWIHDEDFVAAVRWLIARGDFAGPVNLAAPNPLPNALFMRALRQAWGAPIGLPAARWMLAAGAVVLRTEPELILKSRRVVPGRLLAAGFGFRFPEWPDAARDLCRRWRSAAR